MPTCIRLSRPRPPNWRTGVGLALTLLGALSCATTATGRRQLLLISTAQEGQLGAQAFDEVKAKEPACNDAQARALVAAIGKRIADVSPQPGWAWTFELFDGAQTINAFALPGGKVGVYTGLLPAARSAAGLAAVLGHEVAHAILRHGAERVSLSLVVQAGVDAANVSFENSKHRGTIMGAFGLGANLGILLPYSRDMESEADVIGLQYMARAGYDPSEAVEFWKRFRTATGGGAPELLSTHPATETRIAALGAALPKAMALYAQSARLGKGVELPATRCDGSAAPTAAPAVTPAPTAPAPTGDSSDRGDGTSGTRGGSSSRRR